MSPDEKLIEARAAVEDGRYDDAIELATAVIAATGDPEAIRLLADTFEKQGLKAEAAEVFEHLAGREPAEAQRLLLRAAELHAESGRRDKALALVAQVRRHDPHNPAASALFAALTGLVAKPKTVDDVTNEMIESDDPEMLRQAVQRIGDDLRDIRNLTLFGKLRRLFPEDPYIRATLCNFAHEFCDYRTLEREEPALRAEIARGDLRALIAEMPLTNLMWCADEALNRLAVNVSGLKPPPAGSGARRHAMAHQWGERLRIGYLSSDFWDDHATMRLFQSVLTSHDPARFDVTLFCYTPARFIGFDRGQRANWGRIVRIEQMSDEQAMAAIRAEKIDILVDLKGHTGRSRSRLMNLPIAPVHVQWLGFPGSCVNIDCDYVIGDPIVLPDSSKAHYHEKFCRLPESYQPNDPVHRALPAAMSREEAGLPDDRFVFAAFNSQRKNSLECLALWAKVLRASPEALFWLMVDGEQARVATHAQFEKLGVPRAQILFAPKMAYHRHMARVQAADLILDSFPYNGHTTTSDMLWAGLPVLTKRGTNFASRVSESLLNAIGLPELVANDEADFVAQASALSQDRQRLTDLKARLAANRLTAPLFDALRFCRHLETAFAMMAERAKAGLAPDHFDVPARPPEALRR